MCRNFLIYQTSQRFSLQREFYGRRHGWVDADTITIVYRFAEIAAELVRLKVDVIVSRGVLAGSQITCPPAAWSTRRTTMQLPCSSF